MSKEQKANKYRVYLCPIHLTDGEDVALRGSQNRNLSFSQAYERCRIENLESSSETANGRAGTDAYRYNRRFPAGWHLGYDYEY